MLLKGWYSLRGGSWYLGPALARASHRHWIEPSGRFVVFGVRCARKVK